ncbi:isoniazid response ATPase/transcriptional regulator IniR [Mycolicibacterium litorale]|uniref:LuxR family transcriptional regulator n=1 Tax=Mycolicibacterium litorale TaxID=758802 RepID=A0AAD1IND0_9MYCO|nr:isoniazid response ATPase/transcriptional regulator IniR [Mycolicibacterium litorale]MCV7416885.1 LuxR family transcriptional regulator [Mycolicibacterium litorale]TDY04670.1 LuxR family transcriptional regulator [Mycolicibacterium litorale]BBY18096.1 LuxR family transcriptional regulator [Mycolicibacterium litorale]
MTSPSPHRQADVPAAAREVVAAIETDPATPAKVLVTGGIGTGKSTVLAAVRSALRSAGRAVLSRPRRRDDPADAAVVVDDAHLLDDAEIERLTDLVADSAATVVIATQPLAHHPALRALVTALERENPSVTLGSVPPVEVGRAVAATLGAAPAPEVVRLVTTVTAGLPFLLRPALAAVGDGAAAVRQATRIALSERLRRLDEPLLDTLLVASLSPELGPDDVAAALHMTSDAGLAAVDRARASGLLEPSYHHSFLRAVHDGIAQIAGAARHHDIEVSLLRSQLELCTLTADLALRMAEHGLRDERLATALADLATRTGDDPARAARLYRAAADAGATALSARLADALALTGDCSTAGRLADELLTSPDAGERAAAVRISASIAMHDGSATQALDLFRWLGPSSDALLSAAGTVAALAAGDAGTAKELSQTQSAGPPTSTARAARSLAEGLVLSLDEPYPVAVARLGQSLGPEQRRAEVTPDSPAALVTLAALHGGDPVRARSVIGRAVRGGDEDAIFVTHRHRLLLGWTHMQDGQLQAAAASVPRADAGLHRRDALWATALQTAIARRSGDSGAMQMHWFSAMEVLAEYSVDLFALLPLGELWVAAARLRQVERLQHTLDEAFALLRALGDPVLWSVPLHWAGVHAGILANSPEAVAPHGQALTAASRDERAQSAFAKALATAGRTWLRVLANHVEVEEVTAAARALAQFGHTWDATRLAGQAALQTPDARVSQAMLQLARDLKQTVAAPDIPVEVAAPGRAAAEPVPAPAPARPASAQLSEREREVAELLLLGMPYRDIGAQLFISAKTVEHHVARIRRRLGAESRSEMLSMLRALLAPSG